MTKVATAIIELRAESAQLRADLERVEKKFGRTARRSQKQIDRMSRQAVTSFKTLAGAALAAAGVTGLGALTASAAMAADELAKTADKLGVGTKQLAGLQFAARLTGVETTKLNLGLQRLTRRVAEAAQGTGEAQGALKELGLDAGRLTQLSPDEQFRRIGVALSQVGNQSDRVRLGFKLFDSEGVDLIRTLRLSQDQFAAAQKEAEAFGIALSRVDAKRIEEARDQVSRARTAFQGIGTTIAVEASTFTGAFAKAFADSAVEADGFKDTIQAAFENIAVAAGFTVNSIRGIQIALLSAKAAALQASQSVTGGLVDFANEFGPKNKFTGQGILQTILGEEGTGDAFRNVDQIDSIFSKIEQIAAKIASPEEIRSKYQAAVEVARQEAQVQLDALQLAQDNSALGDVATNPNSEANAAFFTSLKDRLTAIEEYYNGTVKAALKAARDRVKLEARAEGAIRQQKAGTLQAAVGFLQALAGESKAAAILAVAINKAQSIAKATQNTAVGVTAALATGNIALAAKIGALGKIQIGLIAATGFAQAASIAGSSGGAALGSVSNPLFTQNSDPFSASTNVAGNDEPNGVTNIIIQGDLIGDSADAILDSLRRKVNDEDEVLFSSSSRQALELVPVT